MRINLDMFILDQSSFNVTIGIAFSFTSRLYMDEHHSRIFLS